VFIDTPTELHQQVVRKIFRYLKGTIDYGLFHKKGKSQELVGFCDNDYAGKKYIRICIFLKWSYNLMVLKKATCGYFINYKSRVYCCSILCMPRYLVEKSSGRSEVLSTRTNYVILWQQFSNKIVKESCLAWKKQAYRYKISFTSFVISLKMVLSN